MNKFASTISVVPTNLWIYFSIGIFVLLIIDLSLFGGGPHKNSKKKALLESGIWITLALLFNAWFTSVYGKDLGLQFLTGYLVEKSLSVDNLFVILLIFNAFRIPGDSQHRVLFFGVLGAIVLRAFFIGVGAQLLHMFHWILYVFGGILVVTAIKFLRESDDHANVGAHWSIRLLNRFVPISHSFNRNHFFIIEGGIKKATPLLVALFVIEVTDVIFAVDSIPAVFAVTQDAFVAFASNILAILGLRALYFVLADWVSKLRYLKPGLAAILGFIGLKMLLMEVFKIPSWVSLLVVFSILITAGLSSWYVAKVEEEKRKSK